MVPLSFGLLLFAGVPIALVLAITAMIYIWASGNDVLFLSYPQQLYGGLEKYGLLAIPLFMLVGELMNEGEFVEVFVDTPFEECARRDPKGLYAKALNGEIQNFTGVDSPYETPERADIHIETMARAPEELVDEVEAWLKARGYC